MTKTGGQKLGWQKLGDQKLSELSDKAGNENQSRVKSLRDLMGATGVLSPSDIDRIADIVRYSSFSKAGVLVGQGDENGLEYFLLSGTARSVVRDEDGREITIEFAVGPCVMSPSMARTAQGYSLVEISGLTDGEVASLEASVLMGLMVECQTIRTWGNAIMQGELQRKVGREWCLAALNAKQRLIWFRSRFPEGERLFPHMHIASYLGMTSVTLSRLRNDGLN